MNINFSSSHGTRRATIIVAMCAPLFACILDVPLGGKACDDQHPCVSGFTCIAGTCLTPVAEGEGEGEAKASCSGREEYFCE